jgi:putative NIF3 family GTP cyclohydrolase 1 type 2
MQIGDANREVTGILLCIDVTEDVIDEAISLGCNLIISHHPLAFRPFKSLTGKNYVERCMLQAIRHDIALYAAHTNLDNARGGVNYKLAEMLELQNVKILQPLENALLKFVTTVPLQHAESVRNACSMPGQTYRELRQLQL